MPSAENKSMTKLLVLLAAAIKPATDPSCRHTTRGNLDLFKGEGIVGKARWTRLPDETSPEGSNGDAGSALVRAAADVPDWLASCCFLLGKLDDCSRF